MADTYIDPIVQSIAHLINARKHILLTGPSGAGKTYRVTELLKYNNKKLKLSWDIVNAVLLKTIDDVGCVIGNVILSQFVKHKVLPICLVIDEIHNLSIELQNYLLTTLETQIVRFESGHSFNLNDFGKNALVVIGITTNSELLFKPFKNRFIELFVDLPDEAERKEFLKNHYKYISKTTDKEIERFIQSTVSFRDMKHIIDIANTVRSINKAMDILQYDKQGLSNKEKLYLRMLQTSSKPLSLGSIASKLMMDTESVKDIEIKLIRKGLIDITNKGRILVKECADAN